MGFFGTGLAAQLVWALFCATAFVVWPTIGKFSGATGHWINTIVLVGSTITGVALAYPAMRAQPLPSLKAVVLISIAGLINGAAVYVYSMMTADPKIPTGTFISTVTMMMVVIGFVLAVILTGQEWTIRHIAGMTLALVGIWLIAG